MIRKAAIVIAMLWAVGVTALRATRLPNNFSIEHWLVDYRFGFVKRGLVGTLLSLGTRAAHARPTLGLINTLAVVIFVTFCAAVVSLGIHLLRRTQWSLEIALAILVFLSSPFIVMSAHLIGYYDNLIVMLTMVSLALLFKKKTWTAAVVQAIAILVHENALLVGFPVFCWAWWLAGHRRQSTLRHFAPLLLPLVTFALIAVAQSTAPGYLEQSLTAHLSTYPFVATTIGVVRVPHWITITFYDSYRLHKGHFQERILSEPMIALVLPTLLALLAVVFDVGLVTAVSIESAMIVIICLIPEGMHVMAWDTSRIWTYSIVNAFLLLWVAVEQPSRRRTTSQFAVFVCLVALVTNAIATTPLMDGLRDHFEVATRLALYAPLVGLAIVLARRGTLPRAEPYAPLAI